MNAAKFWYKVGTTDVRARLLADRHYNRQHPGAPEFTPPGNKVILIVPTADGTAARAVWASQRPDPNADLAKPRADGFDYWVNPIFRNESDIRSSDLIQEAIAITLYYWGSLIPADGFHSFVDPRKVGGVKVRGQWVHGFCFMKAGFELYPERTKERDLLRWILPAAQLRAIHPIKPNFQAVKMFV